MIRRRFLESAHSIANDNSYNRHFELPEIYRPLLREYFKSNWFLYILYVIYVGRKMGVFGLAHPLLSLFYNYVFFIRKLLQFQILY